MTQLHKEVFYLYEGMVSSFVHLDRIHGHRADHLLVSLFIDALGLVRESSEHSQWELGIEDP